MLNDAISTGIEGLDDVLRGGWPRDRLYLVQGEPGVGKTTLAIQFLLNGVQQGESCLYVTLAETRTEVMGVARAHGWDMEKLHIFELSALVEKLSSSDNTLFDPADVDLHEVTGALIAEVERVKPSRVVIDSLSEIRLLAQDSLRYRRQILGLKSFFAGRNATVLLLDDRTVRDSEEQLRSLVHGVVCLEKLSPEYGGERRRLHISKLRGVAFRGGYHDYIIERGGIKVFPRLVAAEHRQASERRVLATGIVGLDTLLCGGVDFGTSTLVVGPAGSGKSTLCIHYALATAALGGRAAFYMFEEGRDTLLSRARALGLPVEQAITDGRLEIRQTDPAEMTPGQFANMVRDRIDNGVDVIIIDSLNGYLSSMPQESFLTLHMHELLTYASQRGVATFLVMAQHGFMGDNMSAPVDVSYIADTVMLLRYFEADGAIRKAISIVKKRSGAHESSIRELAFEKGGAVVGKRLDGFRGVLTGVPEYIGEQDNLLGERPAAAT